MTAVKAINRAVRILASRKYSVNLSTNQFANLWTPDKIVKSPHPDFEIPNRTVVEHIWENLDKWSDKIAIECGVTKRSFTYHELYKYSRNLAARLRSQLKLQDGDVVCVMMANCPEYALTALGVLQAGAVVTTVNPIYTVHEVYHQIALSNPKVIIGRSETIPIIKNALKLAKIDIPIIAIKGNQEELPFGTICFEELSLINTDYSILNDVNRKSEDIAFLPYSSGTTGLPKGVELTNRNIVSNCIQQDIGGVKLYEDTTSSHQDSTLGVLPMFHIYGLVIVLLHKLAVGMKIVSVPKFHPNIMLSVLKEHQFDILYAAPPLVLFLGSHPDVKSSYLESIRKVYCGAAPVPRIDVIKFCERAKKTTFLHAYGATELSPLATASLPGHGDFTNVGFAIANTELKIVDSDLRALGPNEIGEVLVRGPQAMKGYRNNVEATKAAFTEGGWYRTGDLGSIDKYGNLKIADRIKELIKVKGYQVPPAELESILKDHPSIFDAAVVGIPDRRMGEAPRAFVVLKEGHKTDANEIKKFVAQRVAEYKRLKEVTFLETLPKNASGKIVKKVLKEEYCK